MDEILSLIEIVHAIYPMLRFQQMMSIAAQKAGWKENDLFYCPDDTIASGLKFMLNDKNLGKEFFQKHRIKSEKVLTS